MDTNLPSGDYPEVSSTTQENTTAITQEQTNQLENTLPDTTTQNILQTDQSQRLQNDQVDEQDRSNPQEYHDSDKSGKLTLFEKMNRIVVTSREYVDVFLRCKVEQQIIDPVSGRGIRHVLTETKIEKKSKDGTIPVCSYPRTRTLVRMAPMVEFKREPFPMVTEQE